VKLISPNQGSKHIKSTYLTRDT